MQRGHEPGERHRELRAIGCRDIRAVDALDPGPARRVHALPGGGERVLADQPTGVDHVLVNGVAIRTDGRPVPDALPGQRLTGR